MELADSSDPRESERAPHTEWPTILLPDQRQQGVLGPMEHRPCSRVAFQSLGDGRPSRAAEAEMEVSVSRAQCCIQWVAEHARAPIVCCRPAPHSFGLSRTIQSKQRHADGEKNAAVHIGGLVTWIISSLPFIRVVTSLGASPSLPVMKFGHAYSWSIV